ncbi:hypothetical protein DER46DRAFT_509358, partial [Fusarium sp. MPI-SDFR-AT-0072]
VGTAQLCEKIACHALTRREVLILEYGLHNVSKHKRLESEQELYATRVDPQRNSRLPSD